jgi:hypothetical protein
MQRRRNDISARTTRVTVSQAHHRGSHHHLVANGNDVGLDGGVSCIARVACSHVALVKVAFGAVRVVTTGCEDDGTFLTHRLVRARTPARAWRASAIRGGGDGGGGGGGERLSGWVGGWWSL